MTFTVYLKTTLSDFFRVSQPNRNSHVQRHGNKADSPNGSQKGSRQHKTTLPRKGQHPGTITINPTQKHTDIWYLPPNPPALPNSPRPHPIRLPQNPPPTPHPSPPPRPIRLGFPSGVKSQANNTAQAEANNKLLQHPSSTSAPATSLLRPSLPPDIYKPLPPVPLFPENSSMFPFPAAAFTPQLQKGSSTSAKGYVQIQTAQQTHQPQTHKQQQQETEQETEFITLLSLLEKALRHTHYAVCGRAALYVWGYRQNPPENVSIVCPDGNEEVILLWAKTQGWTVVVSGVRGCSFQVNLPGKEGKEGKVREVTVKTAQRMGLTLGCDGDNLHLLGIGKEVEVERGTGTMPMAVKGTWAEAEKKVLKTTAAVVTLPALLGMLIEGFITEVSPLHPHHHHLHQQHQSEPEAEPEAQAQATRDSSKKRLEEAAKIILWVLSRLSERGERLSQDKVPDTFLTPFLAGWPEAHALLEELGVSTFDSHFDYHHDQADPQPEPKPKPQHEHKSEFESGYGSGSGSRSPLTLDASTLAALEGLPLVLCVPPTIPPRSPKRMTPLLQRDPERTASAASSASCKSETTIALIENEIESWNCLSLEEAALATKGYKTASPLLAASQLSRVSRLSTKISTAETDSTADTAETDLMAEMTESINAWTTACSTSSLASSLATSISTVPALSVSASASSLATSISTVPALSVSPSLSVSGLSSSCSSSKKSTSGSPFSSIGTKGRSGRSNVKCVPPPWKSSWDERMVKKEEYPEWI